MTHSHVEKRVFCAQRFKVFKDETAPSIFNTIKFFLSTEKMRILTSLPQETFENLAIALEKYSTIGWKKVMTEGFPHIYSQKDVEEIEQKHSPATALLIDLDGRGESLESLIAALRKIGNKRAVSIINNGRSHTFNTGQTLMMPCSCYDETCTIGKKE